MTESPQYADIPIITWKQTYSIDDTIIPVFFFNPSLEFLDTLQKNPVLYTHVPVHVGGTGGLYDGFHFGTIDRTTTSKWSCCVSDELPVYTVTLPSVSFTIYPSQNGYFRLLL